MATLNSSNVVNGNIVESNDILQLYDAFTAGGGTTGVYDVSISGSLTGSATTAITATSASNITTAITGGGTHYLTFVDQEGTRPPKIASLLEYTAATNSLTVTASRAVTASFASTTSTPTYLNALTSNSGSAYIGVLFGVVAGSLTAAGGIAQTPVCDPLKGKVIGTSLFINATIFGPGAAANSVGVRSYNAGTGQIEFQTGGGTGTEFIMFTAHYKPA
jgi:hypothetical protein